MNHSQRGVSYWLCLLVAVACLSAVGGAMFAGEKQSADEARSAKGRVESSTQLENHEFAPPEHKGAATKLDVLDLIRGRGA